MPPKRKRVVSEEENSEEEEVITTKKNTRKAPTKTQPKRGAKNKQESEEEEEEVKPTKRAPAKRGGRKQKEESEEEEEIIEEEVRPRASTRPQRKKAKASEDDDGTISWERHDSIYYFNDPKSNSGAKVAAFDMDHTLIKPASGKVFAQGRNDWEWLFPVVVKRLQELHNEGYKVVIFSNQGGVEKGKVRIQDVTGKINDMAKSAGVPLCGLLATADDKYRKPSSDFWNYFENNLCIETPSKEESFFCGDFAGRIENWDGKGAKKDKGCSDRKFARNIGLPFYTPEELFFKVSPAKFAWKGIDPKTLPTSGPRSSTNVYHSATQEMIISVGFPASGKSTFARTYLQPNGYVRVNMDTLKTQAKCAKVCREALAEGKSVVIDNTNGPLAKRAEWTKIAKEFSVPVRCFYFDTDEDVCKHMNEFREKITNGEQKHVPSLVYNTFKKNFTEPSKSEGFKEVLKIKFVREHPDEEHSRTFEEFTERIR